MSTRETRIRCAGLALAISLLPAHGLADAGSHRATGRGEQQPAAAEGAIHPALQHVIDGHGRVKAGDDAGAVLEYEAALPGLKALRASNTVTDHQLARVHIAIGRCYERLDRPEDALKPFREAQRLVAGTKIEQTLGERVAALEARLDADEKRERMELARAAQVDPRRHPREGATARPRPPPADVTRSTGFVGGVYLGVGAVGLSNYALDGLALTPGLDASVGGRLEYLFDPAFALRTEVAYRYSRLDFSHALMERSGYFELHSGTLALDGRFGLFETGVFVLGGGHLNVDFSGSKTDIWRDERRTRPSAIGSGITFGGQGGLGYEWIFGDRAVSLEFEGRYTLASVMPGAPGHTTRIGGNVGVRF